MAERANPAEAALIYLCLSFQFVTASDDEVYSAHLRGIDRALRMIDVPSARVRELCTRARAFIDSGSNEARMALYHEAVACVRVWGFKLLDQAEVMA